MPTMTTSSCPTAAAMLAKQQALQDSQDILALLRGTELSTGELSALTERPISDIAARLPVLRESGLVQSRQIGHRAFHRLAAEANAPATRH